LINHEDPFTPVRSKRTFEEVALKIKDLIFEGILKPGDKLPGEEELARKFEVGRQSIREALRVLELSGFITVQTGFGGGSVIENTISKKIVEMLLDAFKLGDFTVDEFTLARLGLEKMIVNEAIDHASKDDIKALEDNIATAKELIAGGQTATIVNFDFHSLLAKASKNKVFVLLEGAINAIHRTLRSRSVVDLKTTSAAVQVHVKILDAIIKKDREKAITLLDRHLRAIAKSLKQESNNA
jgi:DNA-binding FadR family transcriptional regulator